MRGIVIAALLLPGTAWADHTLDASYDASLTSSAGDGARVEAAVAGDASDTISIGSYQIIVAGGLTAHHAEGAGRGTGLATHAVLAADPAPLPPGNKDLHRITTFPFTFELGHDGDLAAMPRLSDRPDMRRAPYAWQRFTAATRAVRIEYAETDDGNGDRQTGASDVGVARAEVTTTEQDGAGRTDATALLGLYSVEARWPFQARADVLALESKVSKLDTGAAVATRTLYFFRLEMPLPSGVTYELSWGKVLDVHDQGPREPIVDHVQEGDIVSIGLGAGNDDYGGGAQFLKRTPYLALDGRAMFDDRGWIEAWFHGKSIRWYGRAFFAHDRRIAGDNIAGGVWTGGVELDASRDVGPIAVELAAEAGRSFYSVVDGATPSPAMGARGALTIRRSDARHWKR